MVVPKILHYAVELRAVRPKVEFSRLPVVYTNDLRSAEFQFEITDMSVTDLSTATATTLLYMRDGSFFQNPKEDVGLVGTTFSYALKENEGNHAGIAKIQLIVTIGEAEYATKLYEFEIINGLETKVAQEVMIYDWTTLTRDARAYIDQFVADELLRDAQFDNAQFDRNITFVETQNQRAADFTAAQDSRTATFNASEVSRTQTFTASEAGREQEFDLAEAGRAAGYTADHSRAETDHTIAVDDSEQAATDHTTAINDHTLAGTDHTRAEADHTRADADSATVAGFNGRLTAEETATANNKISTVKGKTFADVDARFEDVEADTTTMGNNGVSNGNFSNGTTGWTPWAGTLSAANNILSLANDGTNQSASVAQNTSLLLTNGNKYYVRVNARVRSTLANKLELLTYGSSPIVSIASLSTVNNPIGDQWYALSGICTPTTQTVNLRMFLQHQYADAATALGKVMELQNAFAIDLTATFGKGNEPTAEQMDGILAKFTNSWFNGTANLFRANATLNKLMAVDARTEFEARNGVSNGDFSNGTTGWTTVAGTSAVSNSLLTSTGDSNSATPRLYTSPILENNHKYYIVATIKVLSSVCQKIETYLTSVGTTIASVLNPVINTPYRLSGIYTPTGSVGALGLRHSYVDAATANGSAVQISYVSAIDLTATFGAGKEPTLAEMDRLMARFPNSWFDGVKPIQTIETLYQEKANKAQEAWITPTLTNGATGTIQYRKNEFGRVEFKGTLTGTQGVSVFSLPVGYAPASTFRTACVKTDGTSGVRGIYLMSAGSVYLEQPYGTYEVDMNGLSFVQKN